jgi:hypothetical protein
MSRRTPEQNGRSLALTESSWAIPGLFLCIALGVVRLAAAADDGLAAGAKGKPGTPTVGMEGRLEAILPGTMLEAKPVDEKSRVILRIADTRPHGTLTWYDLRFIGLEPGRYDLRDSLVRKDGSGTADLPELPVEVTGLLPPSHRGELVEHPRGVIRFFGSYRKALLAAAVLWLLVLVPLLLLGRKRKVTSSTTPVTQPPTLAERLRPLVEKASTGQLTTAEKAQLERMLLSHWRERLNLNEESPAEAITVLRQHPEAGVLLRALEDWLHRPPGLARANIQELLEPYRYTSMPDANAGTKILRARADPPTHEFSTSMAVAAVAVPLALMSGNGPAVADLWCCRLTTARHVRAFGYDGW